MEKKTDNIIFYGNLNDKNIQGYAYSIYGAGGLCATITTGCGGGGQTPIIFEIIEISNIKGKGYGSKNNRIHGLDNG